MALWQYTLTIVPKNVLLAIYRELPAKIDTDAQGFLKSPEWDIGPFESKVLPLLGSYFSKGTSWSKEIAIWGKNDETCVSILNGEQNLIELTARLDLRALSPLTLELLENLSRVLDAVAIGENGTIFHLDRIALSKELKSSRAFKFVSNPQKFFEDLEQKQKKPVLVD